MKRALNRGDLSQETIKDRMQLQMKDDQKIKYADYIIENNSTEFELFSKIDQIIKKNNMRNFLKIFFTTLFIIHCSSDVSSEDILSDNNGNEGGDGFTGGGNQTIPELDVELITTYNEQTASFSTNYGNYQRNFIVHVPPNFDYETQSLPLVFVLHGYTGQAPIIRQYSGFDQISDQENFIVVYVQGTTDAFGNTGWNVNVVPTFNLVDDVGLFEALIKYFKASYNIDLSLIHI